MEAAHDRAADPHSHREGNLNDYLNEYPVQEGDVVMLPAGIVHAMKRGTIVAEIQENSDITYRLYDYNRVGNDGKKRPLKLQQALDVLDYNLPKESAVLHIDYPANGVANIAQTPLFYDECHSFFRTYTT